MKTTKAKKPVEVIYQHSKDVLSRAHSDGTLALLHLHVEDFFYTLNGYGPLVWKAIDGKKSTNTIKKNIRSKCKVTDIEFNKGFDKVIKDLTKEKLIELAP